jgi:ferric-dicitrate binding protein FerR (iron transport regulator)
MRLLTILGLGHRRRFHRPEEVTSAVSLPVLAVIPRALTGPERSRRRRRIVSWLIAALAAVAASAAALYWWLTQ